MYRNRRGGLTSTSLRTGLRTKRATATAIAVEAIADWTITLVKLSLGNLRFDVRVFSVSGVLLGAQVGAVISPYVPYRLLKTVFSLLCAKHRIYLCHHIVEEVHRGLQLGDLHSLPISGSVDVVSGFAFPHSGLKGED